MSVIIVAAVAVFCVLEILRFDPFEKVTALLSSFPITLIIFIFDPSY